MNLSADNGSDGTPTVWEHTVAALTRASRERVELGELLATALAAAAANAGSRYQLPLRSGSWEAAHVEKLLDGMLGGEEEVDLTWRTEPIVVPLNVPALVSMHAPEHDFDTAADRLVPWADVVGMSEEDAASAQERHDQDYDQLLAQVRSDYESYADRFTTAVQQAAMELTGLVDAEGRLRVPVSVPTHTDPTRDAPPGLSWDDVHDAVMSDLVVAQLWTTARERTGLPPAPQRPDTGAPTS